MAGLRPISRRKLIKRLRELGFSGPFPGTDHELMDRGTDVAQIPNPHKSNEDIRHELLKRILDGAGVSRREWLTGQRDEDRTQQEQGAEEEERNGT